MRFSSKYATWESGIFGRVKKYLFWPHYAGFSVGVVSQEVKAWFLRTR